MENKSIRGKDKLVYEKPELKVIEVSDFCASITACGTSLMTTRTGGGYHLHSSTVFCDNGGVS